MECIATEKGIDGTWNAIDSGHNWSYCNSKLHNAGTHIECIFKLSEILFIVFFSLFLDILWQSNEKYADRSYGWKKF